MAKETATTNLVLDEHLYTPQEIYEKLKTFQRKNIYLNQPQREFIAKHEGKPTEPRKAWYHD